MSIRKKENKEKKPPQSLSPVGEELDRSRSHHFYEREGRKGLKVWRELPRASPAAAHLLPYISISCI